MWARCVTGPLARVPENTFKFTVGAVVLSFGSYWVLEALGYVWPLGDAVLPLLFAFYIAGGLALIRLYAPKTRDAKVV